MQPRTGTEWTRRIERARTLGEFQPSAAELLAFYERILTIQKGIAEDLCANAAANAIGAPIRDLVDLEIPLRHLPELLQAVGHRAGDKFNPEALTSDQVRNFMLGELKREIAPSGEPTPERFVSLVLLQPAMELLATGNPPDVSGNRCPRCDALPLLAILRPEGEGAKRWLQCSLCLTEWPFRRVLCPWCSETDKDKLPRYTAEECNYVRVEACDTCKRYLKSIDMTIEGHAVPIVDEVALAALDVWATEHGFRKLSPNLFGL